MKVVYHPRYLEVYAGDPAAQAGRIESILKEVSPHYQMITPEPASIEDIELVHTKWHIAEIQRMRETYEVALLAAGGAIKSAELAMSGEPAFGLIRPPGHHASPDSCWGFCFFNNMAISIARLRKEGKINRAVILDFDLHFGDGTDNTFSRVPEVVYHHPEDRSRQEFVDGIARFLDRQKSGHNRGLGGLRPRGGGLGRAAHHGGLPDYREAGQGVLAEGVPGEAVRRAGGRLQPQCSGQERQGFP